MKNPADARTYLRELAAAHAGKLTAEAVVEAATPPDHPLHDEFEWDDGKAGPAYRVMQARQLIRSVHIDVTTITHSIRPVWFVRDPACASDEQGYISVPVLKTDAARSRDAIAAELQRVSQALRRARELAIILGLEDLIDTYIEGLTALNAKLQLA